MFVLENSVWLAKACDMIGSNLSRLPALITGLEFHKRQRCLLYFPPAPGPQRKTRDAPRYPHSSLQAESPLHIVCPRSLNKQSRAARAA